MYISYTIVLVIANSRRLLVILKMLDQSAMKPPAQFPFPFTPYIIQEEFMRKLYEAIENKKLAVFESPTGTGKTMSILCGALKWLVDHEEHEHYRLKEESKSASINISESDASTDWFGEQSKILEKRESSLKAKKQLLALEERNKTINEFSSRLKKIQIELDAQVNLTVKNKRQKISEAEKEESVEKEPIPEEGDLLIEDIALDEDYTPCSDVEEVDLPITKIFFASRTHSQLSQVANELRRSPYGKRIRIVSLASRQSLCVNKQVSQLGSIALINERCQELRENKAGGKSSKGGCPYIKNSHTMEALRLTTLLEVCDIEDLSKKGSELCACPYYGSRNALEHAQLVLLPYHTLLHLETRAASGIDLKNSVVIVDEAHNLLDTISNIHSQEVTGCQLFHARSQINQYISCYNHKLSAQSILMCRQLLYIINVMIKSLGGTIKSEEHQRVVDETTVLRLHNFLSDTSIGNIDIRKLLGFCDKSKLAQKLQGFVKRYSVTASIPAPEEKISGMKAFLQSLNTSGNVKPVVDRDPESITLNPHAIRSVIALIQKLTSGSSDSCIFVKKQKTLGQSSMKFILLNPSEHFSDVIQEARCVILAGGTMCPMYEFTDQLFKSSGASDDRIMTFSCNHVVPPENICPIVLTTGACGTKFDFRLQSRFNESMMLDLGRTLVNMMTVIPEGMVIFFSSYEYKEHIEKFWSGKGIISSMEKRKDIYYEPRDSKSVKAILEKYEQSSKTKQGAALLCVVGGKMSEGINFSDHMGRCVAVIGLPYANVTSPELKEKMNYLSNNYPSIGKVSAGCRYYEDLCMKSVNQCIGRAVRHIRDYASMLLLDTRYQQEHIQANLPSWVRNRLNVQTNFGSALSLTKKFFAEKR